MMQSGLLLDWTWKGLLKMTTFLPFSSAGVIRSPCEPTPMPDISFSPSPDHAPLHPQSFTLTVQRQKCLSEEQELFCTEINVPLLYIHAEQMLRWLISNTLVRYRCSLKHVVDAQRCHIHTRVDTFIHISFYHSTNTFPKFLLNQKFMCHLGTRMHIWALDAAICLKVIHWKHSKPENHPAESKIYTHRSHI